MTHFPVTDSTLSAQHLGPFIQAAYGLSLHTTCQLFRTGINHSYIITDQGKKFVFRVFSWQWRSKLEIAEELRLLNLLKDNCIAVSYPIPDSHQQYIQELPAPEGLRYGVLYSFAPGRKNRFFSEETSYSIGVFMAQMHVVTQGLHLERVHYNAHTLTALPYEWAKVHFSAANEEMTYVKKAGEWIAREFENADTTRLRRGAVHLDVWFDNMHMDSDGGITVFDFDFCGNGWLLLDVAYFVMQLYHTEPDKVGYQAKVDSFFKGYETITHLNGEEKRLLPLAGASLWIFYLGVQSQRFDNWSNVFLNEDYLKRFMGMAKDWLKYNQVVMDGVVERYPK